MAVSSHARILHADLTAHTCIPWPGNLGVCNVPVPCTLCPHPFVSFLNRTSNQAESTPACCGFAQPISRVLSLDDRPASWDSWVFHSICSPCFYKAKAGHVGQQQPETQQNENLFLL